MPDAPKTDFAHHVELLAKQEGVSEADAKIRVWMEGPCAYEQRLARKESSHG